mmetsp:Transcript_70597/g.132109  ORF Transcript_70597/g.132109 Transcript_70597/m.132109 type:complete len:167 (+) Transcript_70597:86-586(+)
MRTVAGPTAPKSSLTLELLLLLDGIATRIFVVLLILLLLGKPYYLTYPSGHAELEMMLLLCHAAAQNARSWLGTSGNKTEHATLMAIFLAATAWSVFVAGYFWKLQTKGLRVESVLAAGMVGLSAVEALVAVLVGLTFCKQAGEFVKVFLGFALSAVAIIGVVLLI